MIVLVVAAVAFAGFSNFWVNWAWFKSVDYTNVFTKALTYQVALFSVTALVTFVVVSLALRIAYRSRPMNVPRTPEEVALARYREGIEPFRRGLFIAAPVILAGLFGAAAAGEWSTVLLALNSTPFGQTDSYFGQDISFFVFTLPALLMVSSLLFAVVLLAFIGSVVINYLYGGFKRQGDQPPTGRRQLFIFLGLLAALKSISYYLDRFSLATESNALMTGMRYVDVNAVVPAKNIMAMIALATALLFLISIVRLNWNLPFVALAVMLASSVLIGGLYPAFVQQVQVKPSELARETPYLNINLAATKAAYGLTDVNVVDYQAIEDPSGVSLSADQGTLSNVRLLDPSVVSPTFRTLQQIRSFYAFPDSLDIDRYTIDGQKRGTVLAVREVSLDGVANDQRNWFNDHMVFTHGYGVVAAFDNSASTDGSPAFSESDIPPQGALNITEPRVYFGERSPEYSIVGVPAGTEARELDYPDDKSANGQTNNTYAGSGGVSIGNPLQRAIFAMAYQEPNILLSNQINAESKILYDRDPATRVAKVAPWLTLDSDPYPTVVEGRIVWVVDGYTTSNRYPNSARVSLRDVTTDSVNADETALDSLLDENITYMRNAVKATVDAYDGTVKLYAWDESDPILSSWSKIFPGVVAPKASIPEQLLEHVRYPEDMFKVQRDILAKYHVNDAQAFYSGQDFWNIPDDPTKPDVKQPQPPYYMSLQMPGETQSAFSLTSTFAPNKRATLAAFMAVNSDPGENYGKITVLQLPRNTTIPGPTQVQNNFESDPEVSAELSLLRRGGSEVTLGNLLSLPVAGGLLYVEPVYVQASAGDGYPLLRKVLVSYGTTVAFEDDLATALKVIFDETIAAPTTPGEEPTDSDLAAAISAANQAFAESQKALADGDFAAYGQALEKLEAALADITAANAK
jgi:uncharacterized membrane protein (UPF0182 family)